MSQLDTKILYTFYLSFYTAISKFTVHRASHLIFDSLVYSLYTDRIGWYLLYYICFTTFTILYFNYIIFYTQYLARAIIRVVSASGLGVVLLSSIVTSVTSISLAAICTNGEVKGGEKII